ncbi:MAG: NADH-quinone oxidoreductase subunit NuoE [Planctomycetes bacterium]|nr:NADH-quinone oxidoreductase subunit NuoE [Planctomycetota bacterium]
MSFEKCKKQLETILASCEGKRESLLPCLHAACEQCGHVSEEVISYLAEKLDLPRVEVYSAASFYSMFSLEEMGENVIRVCVSLSCYLKGSNKVIKALESELSITAGQTTPDKKFTIEPVSCLGLCDKAPAMMVNEEVYGDLTAEKIKGIINQYKQKETR